jgi:hypothetical protein
VYLGDHDVPDACERRGTVAGGDLDAAASREEGLAKGCRAEIGKRSPWNIAWNNPPTLFK